MQVDRIVGQNSGVDMADILQYRQQFYEGNYDIRILAETNESPRSIVMKILKALDEMQNPKGSSIAYKLSIFMFELFFVF